MNGEPPAPDRRTDITGILLVGGNRRCLGRDKAFAEFSGRPLFERALEVFRERFEMILLVGDRSERFAAYGNSFFNVDTTGECDRLGKGLPQ
jgi:molybdopterin-guanine dinucleotide biosynthesis protein A